MNALCSSIPRLPHHGSGGIIRGGTKQRSTRGFTLLEVILALMIFSIAVVSLVGAINGMGIASIEARDVREVESRVETALLETTRLPPKEILAGAKDFEKTQRDGDIETKIKIDTLTWQTEDGQPLSGLYMLKVTGRRKSQNDREAITAECVLYPPLYPSNGHP
jgi:prepilin-type N-terminal cleavage/methylation domain-containing protein